MNKTFLKDKKWLDVQMAFVISVIFGVSIVVWCRNFSTDGKGDLAMLGTIEKTSINQSLSLHVNKVIALTEGVGFYPFPSALIAHIFYGSSGEVMDAPSSDNEEFNHFQSLVPISEEWVHQNQVFSTCLKSATNPEFFELQRVHNLLKQFWFELPLENELQYQMIRMT